LRVVIASPYLPWPLNDGGKAAQYRTLEALQDCCDFTLLVPIDNLEQDRNAKMLAERLPRVTVDAVRQFRPAAPPSLRSMARKAGDRILRKLLPEPAPWPEPPPDDSPFYPFNGVSRLFLTALERHLAKGCDIFQAEFAEMLPLGPLMNGRLPSLFVHHQLHFVYARRFLEGRTSVSIMARYLTERMNREERTYLDTFDAAIVFSEVDRSALADFSPQLPVYVSPFPAPEDLPATAALCSKTINSFVFVASESHRPNVEGLEWFLRDVWPIIKRNLPDVAFEVVGEWSVAAQARLPNYQDVRFLGFAPDLGKVLQGRIMVVPVRVGSGIRTKILAAWGASCPVVATTIGAEGLPGTAGEHYAIADGAMEFASACIELAQDVGALNRMIANGLEMARKFYSPEAVRNARMNCYEKLLAAGPKFKP
jgi:glycosyltransferase involved in cell wall biosynthesis